MFSGYDSESSILNVYKNENDPSLSKILGAVIFTNFVYNSETVPNDLTYKIRLAYTPTFYKNAATANSNWQTDKTFPSTQTVSKSTPVQYILSMQQKV
jgi:hypothetical protein